MSEAFYSFKFFLILNEILFSKIHEVVNFTNVPL